MSHPRLHIGLFAAALMTSATAYAQSGSSQPVPSQGQAMKVLPDACRKAAQGSHMNQMMQSESQAAMPMDGMPQANRAYMDAMRDMNPPMMLGMSISDPNLVFVCSMIPHHQGAIGMAKAALNSAKDPEVRRMAERTIKEQGKEIEEMSKMAEKLAK